MFCVQQLDDDQWADGNIVTRLRLTSEWEYVGRYMYSHKEAKREANFMKQVEVGALYHDIKYVYFRNSR